MARTESTETAGYINREWLACASVNATPGEPVADWFARVSNATKVVIDPGGYVWMLRAGSPGRWLRQAEIDDLVARIDAGV